MTEKKSNATKRLFLILTFLFVHNLFVWAQKVAFENASVISASQIASDVGVSIMQKGGNAIDAAVAVQFALAVTYPRAGNIGGGGFMIIRLSNGETAALDFREKAPNAANRDMFLSSNGVVNHEASTTSYLSVGVPGTVDGMIKALEKYGSMPLEMVIAPAIDLAQSGFSLPFEEAESLNEYATQFSRHEGSKKYFIKEDGTPWKSGDIFVQTDLAETLNRISRLGRDGFYAGPTADFIVQEMKEHGGKIRLLDLREYQSVWRSPLIFSYKNYQLITMPPPSSGGVAMNQILALLEDKNLNSLEFGSSKSIHLITEAEKRAFADRAYFLGDPDFIKVPTRVLTSTFYLDKNKRPIDESRATPSSTLSHGEIPGFLESTETTHYSVVDQFGNAVSVTTTLNGNYGSKISVTGAGFLLNNEMDDFSSKPGVPNQFGLIGSTANQIAPNKRPLSSMTPTIVTQNDKLFLILGAAGGPRIISSITQVFLNMVEWNMDVHQAVAVPRTHHQWLPDAIYYEPFGISSDTKNALEAMGHLFSSKPQYLSRVHALHISETGTITPSWEPRGPTGISGF